MPNPQETSKTDAGAAGVPLESVSPAEQEEVEALQAKEQMGEGAATEPRREGSLGRKEPPDTAGTNPKRTENSRAD